MRLAVVVGEPLHWIDATLCAADYLDGDDVLPGFRASVAALVDRR